MTTETLPRSQDWLPRPGTYAAPPGRCIIELTARFGPFVTLRRRLTVVSAVLAITDEPRTSALELHLTGGPLRQRTLSFTGTDFARRPADGPEATHLIAHGHLGPVRPILPGAAAPGTAPRGVAEVPTGNHPVSTSAPCDAPHQPPRSDRPGSAGQTLAVHRATVPAVWWLRIVRRTDDGLTVTGNTQVPCRDLRRSASLPLPRTRPADRLRLLVAAEFV
ncbi:hypothetical protein OG607_25340 [Streptomyces sp. NBC_01537]|uniref:hypothetical protein n=1 Tax=Streptomyces sp. NBC_01537 TaxID=2903896 RepID=UPI00386CDE65